MFNPKSLLNHLRRPLVSTKTTNQNNYCLYLLLQFYEGCLPLGTIFHFHCHLTPRYNGDMDNPRGGVRHCVAGKGVGITSLTKKGN